MAKLTREQQTHAVQALACFDSPSVVAAALRKEFGVTLTPQSIEAYDPTKKAGRNLSARWKSLFEETRKSFLEDTASIAISHRAVRLRALQRMAEKSEGQGNMVLSASLLEQAAKETGGAYTNKRTIEHGGEIGFRKATELTDDELAAIAATGRIGASEEKEG